MNNKRTLLVASTNSKKLEELQSFLKGMQIELLCLKDLPHYTEVEENGKTFEENAVKKAMGYAQQSGYLTLADDSGLCCDALEGAPGVLSARFAGLDKSDAENNKKLLAIFKPIPDNCRGAKFVSCVALAEPKKLVGVVLGEVSGYIAKELHGDNGFGYDSLFYYPDFGSTFGEVSAEMKRSVSHRTAALKKVAGLLEDHLAKANLSA